MICRRTWPTYLQVRGKPAETVLRRWFGGDPAPERRRRAPPLAAPPASPTASPTAGKRNGFVFGTGEWSDPSIGADSAAALESIDTAVSAGANALEFMVCSADAEAR